MNQELSDVEMVELLALLAEAEERHRCDLQNVAAATGRAAAEMTDRELTRWSVGASKLQDAQVAMTTARNVRRSKLGNLVGVALPLWAFGITLFDRGFLLPLIWTVAVSVDAFGHSRCLRLAPVIDSTMKDASSTTANTVGVLEVTQDARHVLRNAREFNLWETLTPSVDAVSALDKAITSGDQALRQACTLGRLISVASLTLLVADELVAKTNLMVAARSPWIAVGVGLLGLFGLAWWTAARAYVATVEQPPYPPTGSAQRFMDSVQHEAHFAAVPRHSFTSYAVISSHFAEPVRQTPLLRKALLTLERNEHRLQDCEWNLAIAQAERQQARQSQLR